MLNIWAYKCAWAFIFLTYIDDSKRSRGQTSSTSEQTEYYMLLSPGSKVRVKKSRNNTSCGYSCALQGTLIPRTAIQGQIGHPDTDPYTYNCLYYVRINSDVVLMKLQRCGYLNVKVYCGSSVSPTSLSRLSTLLSSLKLSAHFGHIPLLIEWRRIKMQWFHSLSMRSSLSI
jgi:hypothetical protein